MTVDTADLKWIRTLHWSGVLSCLQGSRSECHWVGDINIKKPMKCFLFKNTSILWWTMFRISFILKFSPPKIDVPFPQDLYICGKDYYKVAIQSLCTYLPALWFCVATIEKAYSNTFFKCKTALHMTLDQPSSSSFFICSSQEKIAALSPIMECSEMQHSERKRDCPEHHRLCARPLKLSETVCPSTLKPNISHSLGI
jgi:hypothetical protein